MEEAGSRRGDWAEHEVSIGITTKIIADYEEMTAKGQARNEAIPTMSIENGRDASIYTIT